MLYICRTTCLRQVTSASTATLVVVMIDADVGAHFWMMAVAMASTLPVVGRLLMQWLGIIILSVVVWHTQLKSQCCSMTKHARYSDLGCI
jgi:hypothetical protein